MIKIHYDFTDGSEISYSEGLEKKDGFNTCCLDFFTIENEAQDIVVFDSKGNTLSRNRLMENNGVYTSKEIRIPHNILKMFKANSFNWRKQ